MNQLHKKGRSGGFECRNVLLDWKGKAWVLALLILFAAALFLPGVAAAIGSNSEILSAGTYHTCGVQTDGTVVCWGDDYYYQASPPPGTFRQVSGGATHTCGIKTDETVVCWGNNSFGRTDPPEETFTQVSSGGTHTCGVKTDGTVACWGLGETITDSGFEFGQADPPAGAFEQVSAGDYHTCGVKTDGTVACWGNPADGRTDPDGVTFTQVSAGRTHTCGVKTDGTVTCWGDDSYHQAADPSPEETFTQVSAGDYHTCGVKTGGLAACWGWNYYGQATVPDDSWTFTQVSSGGTHTCGIKTDGTVACWGQNNSLQATPPDNLILMGGRKGLPWLMLLLDDCDNVTDCNDTDCLNNINCTSSQAILIDHTSLEEVDNIPDTMLNAARVLSMSLDHASVGNNINNGMEDLKAVDATRYAYPNWDWRNRGNPGWQEKVDQFVGWVADHENDYDVFQMKFCYIDYTAQWTYYRDAMLNLEATYPSKIFVWWTMPIMTTGNVNRDAFNMEVRNYCSANGKPLYDIAAIESHDPLGTPISEGGYEAMYSGYSDDGGHLNSTGRLRAAQGMWLLMARLAGWTP